MTMIRLLEADLGYNVKRKKKCKTKINDDDEEEKK